MRRMFVPVDGIDIVKIFVTALAVMQIALFIATPSGLLGENIALIRKGIMIDPALADCPGVGTGWSDIATGYFTVSIDGRVDRDTVERQLRRNSYSFLFFGKNTRNNGTIEERIASRLDTLCERAMDILDMYPKMQKVGIRIFKNSQDLNTAYQMLTGKQGDVKAFHVNDYGMIYTSEDTISDSVMVHEIAHAIVDSYYKGIPPPDVGEMLASYVDMHISD